jgi:RND family efflux transporter MFP subunit
MAYSKWPAALIAGLSLALGGCGASEKEAREKITAPAPVVEAVLVEAGGGAGEIRASGVIAWQKEAPLAFKTGGVIGAIGVDDGDRVRAGQTLASLNLTELNAGVSEADAALRTAEANFSRAKTLHEKGLVAQARLDDAQLQLDRARAARQSISFNRNQGVIVAPSDGLILRRRAEANQTVAAGQAILDFGDTRSGLIMRASVSGAEATRLRVGADAQVRLDGIASPRVGKVSRIAAKSDAATGAFDVEVAIANAADLRSGQIGEATMKGASAGDGAGVIRIPLLALLDARADQGFVYVIDGQNVARRRAVQTVGVDGDVALIASGLQPGEKIISAGAAYVRDGQTVSISNAD